MYRETDSNNRRTGIHWSCRVRAFACLLALFGILLGPAERSWAVPHLNEIAATAVSHADGPSTTDLSDEGKGLASQSCGHHAQCSSAALLPAAPTAGWTGKAPFRIAGNRLARDRVTSPLRHPPKI